MASCFDYYAGLAEKLDERQGTPIDVGMEEFRVKVKREPLGVVGLITPWNYPLLMATVSASGYQALRVHVRHARVVSCIALQG